MNDLNKYKIVLFLFITTLTSCYKKDLEEFKNAKFDIKSEIAVPLFNANITVKDSLSYYIPNFNLSDSLYLTNDLNISDSINLSFDGYTLKDIQFKVYIKNNFPIKGSLQVYFLNANNSIVDSLFTIDKYTIQNVNNGTTTISEVYIDLNEDKYRRIVNCKKVKIIYSIKKDNSNYEPYQLSIGGGVILKIDKKL